VTTAGFAAGLHRCAPSGGRGLFVRCRFLHSPTLHAFRDRLKVPGDPLILRSRHEPCANRLLGNFGGTVELACEPLQLRVIRRRSVFGRAHVGEPQQGVAKSVSGTGQLLEVLGLFALENHG